MERNSSSSTRRWLLLGALLTAAIVLLSVFLRRDTDAAPIVRGDVGACSQLKGDAARACYSREVGLELAAVGATTVSAPSGSGQITFTSVEQAEPLLCDLHARVGMIDAQTPSWLGWTEPLVPAAPVT